MNREELERRIANERALDKVPNLSGMRISETDLAGIDFKECNLQGTEFSGTIETVKGRPSRNHGSMGINRSEGGNFERRVLPDLVKANLNGADLRNATFSHANLSSANLEGADLQRSKFDHVNLCEANLRGLDLKAADLNGADLKNADLSGADLTGLDLRTINLSGANLTGACLDGVNLNGADLSGVNLTDATVNGASLLGTDLRKATLQNTEFFNVAVTEENGFMSTISALSSSMAEAGVIVVSSSIFLLGPCVLVFVAFSYMCGGFIPTFLIPTTRQALVFILALASLLLISIIYAGIRKRVGTIIKPATKLPPTHQFTPMGIQPIESPKQIAQNLPDPIIDILKQAPSLRSHTDSTE